jgi:glyceraldehyde 3-phosphate dehydrogenase
MVTLDILKYCSRAVRETITEGIPAQIVIPITQGVIYGWYDNELGSYTNMLGDLTTKIASEVYQ